MSSVWHRLSVALSMLIAPLATRTALAAEDGCAPLLEAFNTQLTEQEIPQNDPRALKAWVDARPYCETGHGDQALEVLNTMLAEAGAPPLPASLAAQGEGKAGD